MTEPWHIQPEGVECCPVWRDLSDDELLVRLRQRGTPLHESNKLVTWRDNGVTAQVIDDVIERGW